MVAPPVRRRARGFRSGAFAKGMLTDMIRPDPNHHPRPSASHSASLRAEIDRISKLTIEQRIKMALSLDRRFQGLQATPRKE